MADLDRKIYSVNDAIQIENNAYNKALEDCYDVIKQCWLNGTYFGTDFIKKEIAGIEKLRKGAMTVEDLIKQVQRASLTMTGYVPNHLPVILFTFEYLENNGYFKNKEDKDSLCDYYFNNYASNDVSLYGMMDQFVRWLYENGYLKGV